MLDSNIPGGFVLLSRKLLDSGIMGKPPIYFKLWVLLLLDARHKDGKGLKRGQLITSVPALQDRLSYRIGYRIERPSKKQIYDIIKWLRNPHEEVTESETNGAMIVTTKVTHGMLVTICNYDIYQDPQSYEGNTESPTIVTPKVTRRSNSGNNNNKNVKNVIKEEGNIYREIQHLSLSVDDFEKLAAEYGEPAVNDILDQMENYAGLKKYKSAYLTARAWLKRRKDTTAGKSATPEQEERAERLAEYNQYFENLRRRQEEMLNADK